MIVGRLVDARELLELLLDAADAINRGAIDDCLVDELRAYARRVRADHPALDEPPPPGRSTP